MKRCNIINNIYYYLNYIAKENRKENRKNFIFAFVKFVFSSFYIETNQKYLSYGFLLF